MAGLTTHQVKLRKSQREWREGRQRHRRRKRSYFYHPWLVFFFFFLLVENKKLVWIWKKTWDAALAIEGRYECLVSILWSPNCLDQLVDVVCCPYWYVWGNSLQLHSSFFVTWVVIAYFLQRVEACGKLIESWFGNYNLILKNILIWYQTSFDGLAFLYSFG